VDLFCEECLGCHGNGQWWFNLSLILVWYKLETFYWQFAFDKILK